MKYSFAIAALAAGAAAHYPVAPPPAAAASSSSEVAAVPSSSAPVEGYPVATPPSVSAAESKSTPAATYPAGPVATPPAAGNGTAPVSSEAIKYTTEIVDKYTTFCPGPTQITYGTKTYTVTEPTTLTISDCPCTVSKPVYTTSTVACSTCSAAPVQPPKIFNNGTVPAVPAKPTTLEPAPTGGYPTKPTTPGAPVPTAGASKMAFGGLAAFGLAVLAL